MFDQLLTEDMSFASYMDVNELRLLYYGRNGIYVSFSDNEKLDMRGFDRSELKRPYSIRAYTIDTVVGRKASTNKLYGHVFRVRTSGEFVSDIKSFSSEDYAVVKETLYNLPYIDEIELNSYIGLVDNNLRLRRPFERFWLLTQYLSEGRGSNSDKIWRRILIDLGFSGFNDPSGTGVFGKRNSPITLILEEEDVEMFDIVPVQKYREEKRNRIRDNVNRKNRLTRTARNRVAKRKTATHRDVSGSSKSIEV